MAKGRRTSLAIHAAALLLALALAGFAAWLWLRDAPREVSTARAPEGAEDASAPPLHREHSEEDRDALQDILRGEKGEAQ